MQGALPPIFHASKDPVSLGQPFSKPSSAGIRSRWFGIALAPASSSFPWTLECWTAATEKTADILPQDSGNGCVAVLCSLNNR